MSDKNNNFSFSGFPENNEFEIPDEVTPTRNNMGNPKDFLKGLSNMTPEELKKSLPKEALDELEGIAQLQNISVDELLSSCSDVSQKLLNNGLNEILKMFESFLEDEFDDEEENEYYDDENNEDESFSYELSKAKYLNSNYFGSISCLKNPDIYTDFIEKYGTDSTKYLDVNTGVKNFHYTPLTAQLPFQNIKNLRFIDSTDKFILFFAEMDIENVYGFFISIIQDEDGFSLYVPEFRNTFDVDSADNVSLFNIEKNPELFSQDISGNYIFNELSLSSIEFATNFALAPIKRVLLSPHQFGTIKNTIPPINGDAMFLQVGTITSNEKPESILLKKDAELDLDKTTFPLYFNFKRVIEKDSLMEISQILFKTDLNKAPILDYAELKYTNDKKLYVEIDLGDF